MVLLTRHLLQQLVAPSHHDGSVNSVLDEARDKQRVLEIRVQRALGYIRKFECCAGDRMQRPKAQDAQRTKAL